MEVSKAQGTGVQAAATRAGLRLRGSVRLRVEYDDRTPFGSPMGPRPEQSVRDLFAPVLDHVQRHGYGGLPAAATPLLDAVVRSAGFAEIARVDGDRWSLAPAVLYPEPESAAPRTLAIVDDAGAGLQLEIPTPAWPQVHWLLASLAGPGLGSRAVTGDAAAVVGALAARGLATSGDGAGTTTLPQPLDEAELLFLGHNTVLVRSDEAAVLVDPFLPAASARYPDGYQPLSASHLGALSAVLVTHGHPDHFDPASLLRIPPSTPVVVPRVERETVLSAHMARRLEELGFTAVIEMGWGERRRFGDVEVVALPFYGEQPAEVDVLHPEVRNQGNVYLVRAPRFSAAFLADSGTDPAGEVRRVATEARARFGAVDVLFAGYRGWVTYPVQLLFSSVARFLLFVPAAQWEVRQRLMADAEDAVDLAERWGARILVPYADGGAPWHWELGLGPRLDGSGDERIGFDPFPERVGHAARNRVQMPDGRMAGWAGRVLLLRPNDGLAGVAGTPRRLRAPGHAWPWSDDEGQAH